MVRGIERALAHPAELADERRRVAHQVVGEVDGRAGERVVDAIAGATVAVAGSGAQSSSRSRSRSSLGATR